MRMNFPAFADGAHMKKVTPWISKSRHADKSSRYLRGTCFGKTIMPKFFSIFFNLFFFIELFVNFLNERHILDAFCWGGGVGECPYFNND